MGITLNIKKLTVILPLVMFCFTPFYCKTFSVKTDKASMSFRGKELNLSTYDTGMPISADSIKLTDLPESVSIWNLKTNFLCWVATIPNLTADYKIKDHWSVGLGLWWCPWKISEKHSLKILSILPEARYWMSKETKGHFFDVHLTLAWYNLRWNKSRYQDTTRPLLGAGIGYGYLFQLTRNCGLELNIGVGYLNTRYDTYYNIPNGALIDTRETSYFGIDRIGFSFVYCFTP